VCLWRRAGLLCKSFEERKPLLQGTNAPASALALGRIDTRSFSESQQQKASPHSHATASPRSTASAPWSFSQPRSALWTSPSTAGEDSPAGQGLGRLLHQATHTWWQTPSPCHSHPHTALQPGITAASSAPSPLSAVAGAGSPDPAYAQTQA